MLERGVKSALQFDIALILNNIAFDSLIGYLWKLNHNPEVVMQTKGSILTLFSLWKIMSK